MALNMPLPLNINSMQWEDTSNKESDIIMAMQGTHNSLEVLFKVDSDILKLWDRIKHTVHLITTIQVIKEIPTILEPVGTKTRAAEVVVIVDVIITTITNIRTSTILNSMVDMVDNPTE